MALITSVVVATAQALVLAVAALSAAPPAPIGLPSCSTTCGNLSVPYPFGFQPGCYRPGFNLTCDTTGGAPRLLLGDGTLRVADIFINNATVRVLRDGSMLNVTGNGNITSDGLKVKFAPIFAGGHYRISSVFDNELVVFGCGLLATLVMDTIRPVHNGNNGPGVIGCVSYCLDYVEFWGDNQNYCYGGGCCQASIFLTATDLVPTELRLSAIGSRNNSDDKDVSMFVAERGWLDSKRNLSHFKPKNDIPLSLRWDITQGLKGYPYSTELFICPSEVASICRSNNSECSSYGEVMMCSCKQGYDGNPYVTDGCQA